MGSEVRIGGHLGMDVLRLGDGKVKHQALHDLDNGQVTREVGLDLYELNAVALANAVRIQRRIDGHGYAPKILDAGDGWLIEEDMGDTEPVTDGEAFRRNCTRVLGMIRRDGIRHGDLNGPNLVIRDNWPWVVDWTEAHLLEETAPQKSPFSDSYLMWRSVIGTVGPDGQYDTPRVARRWLAVLGALGAAQHLGLPLKGQVLVDLGCFQGDFVAMATTEGMYGKGMDQGGFRSGEDSIEIAKSLWPKPTWADLMFEKGDVVEYIHSRLSIPTTENVALLFSTWAYIVKDFGKEKAVRFLHELRDAVETTFFETQLAGDGPGPDFLPTDEAVNEMLSAIWPSVRPIITIPVTGRPATRTVWMLR